MEHRVRHALLMALAASCVACGKAEDSARSIDNSIAGKADVDPALAAALEDQIMVDTSLSAQANDNAIRPPREPLQTPIPPDTPGARAPQPGEAPTLGSFAEQQAVENKNAFNGCSLDVRYSARFSAQLPADLPLYSGAQVIEAAGSDDNSCKLRAVSFATTAAVDEVVAHYIASSRKAGYAPAERAQGNGKFVFGHRAADGAAFYVLVQPQGLGAEADLVVNNGI